MTQLVDSEAYRRLGNGVVVVSKRDSTRPNLVRILYVRWYTTLAGLLFTALLAAGAFAVIHPQYTSSGTAVLVQPKRPETETANPLLAFNPSLNTTALIVVQALNAPQTADELGLVRGRDTLSASNEGSGVLRYDGSGQPFISVTAQSPEPQRSSEIVAWAMELAQQELTDRQGELRVTSHYAVLLQPVVSATPPVPVRSNQLRAVLLAVVLGLLITIAMVYGVDAGIRRRKHSDAVRVPGTGSSVSDAWPSETPRG